MSDPLCKCGYLLSEHYDVVFPDGEDVKACPEEWEAYAGRSNRFHEEED